MGCCCVLKNVPFIIIVKFCHMSRHEPEVQYVFLALHMYLHLKRYKEVRLLAEWLNTGQATDIDYVYHERSVSTYLHPSRYVSTVLKGLKPNWLHVLFSENTFSLS